MVIFILYIYIYISLILYIYIYSFILVSRCGYFLAGRANGYAFESLVVGFISFWMVGFVKRSLWVSDLASGIDLF